jgi:hypothetical protein
MTILSFMRGITSGIATLDYTGQCDGCFKLFWVIAFLQLLTIDIGEICKLESSIGELETLLRGSTLGGFSNHVIKHLIKSCAVKPNQCGGAKSGNADALVPIIGWAEDEITRLVAAECAIFVNPFPPRLKTRAHPRVHERERHVACTHVYMNTLLALTSRLYPPLAITSRPLMHRRHVSSA